jgi:hypothetical protein
MGSSYFERLRRGISIEGGAFSTSRYWLAVSAVFHRQIEVNKDWARTKGYLLDF